MKIFRLLAPPMKVSQITYVIYKTTSQVFLNYCTTLQCHVMSYHDTQFLCNFFAQLYISQTKKSLKMQIISSVSATVKFNKFLMPFMKAQVIFSSNFASIFSIIVHNPSVIFHLKNYTLWSKGAHESANFETLECWVKIRQISHIIFASTSQFFFKFRIILQWYYT